MREPVGGSILILVKYTVSNRLHRSHDTDIRVATLHNEKAYLGLTADTLAERLRKTTAEGTCGLRLVF